jgi:hypothetical protein
VIFRLGITESARNAIVWNGEASVHPSLAAASMQPRLASTTSASGASEMIPAIGSGSSARTPRSSTTTTPPPISDNRAMARAMSWSSTPTTTMLCASCENVEARAPERRPNPRTSPRPIRPVPRWRSITAILARSRSGSATACPSSNVGSSTSDSVRIWSGITPITRACPRPRDRKSRAATCRTRTVCLTHSGTSTRSIASTGRPRLRTVSGTKLSGSLSRSRSAW